MTPFQQAVIPPSEVQALRQNLLDRFTSHPEALAEVGLPPDTPPGMVSAKIDLFLADQLRGLIFKNDTYQVLVRDHTVGGNWPEMLELSIRRLDRQPIHDWRALQAIKDELVGPEHEAVELYPAQARLLDTANQFWIYVLKNPKIRFPFGFQEGRISGDALGKSVQRPLGEPLTEKGASS